ncbi:hypothetical protein XaFJ1_GM000010 (plasmid) [Xanthomonas albilineans]|nr:hypothetical protein XaFJ1_GM000010 [Xanthomonas albilineans]
MTTIEQRFHWRDAIFIALSVIGFMVATGCLAALVPLSTYILKTTPAGVVQTVSVDPGSNGNFSGIGTDGRGIGVVAGSMSSSPRSVITTDTGRFVVEGGRQC